MSMLGLAALATTLAVAPGQVPVAAAPSDAACHASVDEAAMQALSVAMALPADVEHGGAIYERGEGCFVFSTPVTNNRPLRVVFQVLSSRTLRLAGLYHTHTSSSLPDAFSGDDVLQARISDVPSFIGVHGRNHVRKLRRGYYDYSPRDLMDRTLLRSGVKGVVLDRLPAQASCASCS